MDAAGFAPYVIATDITYHRTPDRNYTHIIIISRYASAQCSLDSQTPFLIILSTLRHIFIIQLIKIMYVSDRL